MSTIPQPTEAGPSDAWLETSDGCQWPLRGNCHLGRAPENDIVIDHPKASRMHAAIHAQDETEFWLLDLGSRNGTFLNERRLIRPTPLHRGDSVSIGGRTFTFHQPRGHHRQPDHSTTVSGTDATVLDLRQANAWLFIADIEKFTRLTRDWEADEVAVSVGCWLRDSRRLIARHHGHIPKYLGDGFLACWEARADTAAHVAAALRDFQHLRNVHIPREKNAKPIRFRVAVHYGLVTFGGQSDTGEESMLGPEMNYIFRLEDLASELGINFCLSSTAQEQLGDLVLSRSVAGEHALKGFDGACHCFSVLEDA